MIFQATWEAVLNGTKTETRRICKPGEWLSESKLGAPKAVYIGPLPHERLKWMVGYDYAVQPARGQKAVGHIRLLDIRQERLQDIDEAGAKAEGCDVTYYPEFGAGYVTQGNVHQTAKQNYRNLWNSIHTRKGERWDDNPLCWVIRFELMGALK
jgi:hypothetical protein